ncbi:phospholipase A2 A2-actitoxin-Cgg2a-like [Stylophora pistillata]|uniref:phospholipase A2 A2-actitoxin-Cgg2a-like n=1 Tax=Stylophora pistillata TaxID=50429 RepID=UPI000C04EE8F|nr:phospholipase A2 A2-actitoxin-Cgg2a-like [Stylophora pistillata]
MGSNSLLLWPILLGVIASGDGNDSATKRNIINFGLLVYKFTERNPIDFNGYGCFCGLGGKGKPVDDLDRCCEAHDNCYSKIMHSEDCPYEKAVYLMSYSVTKDDEKTECEPASSYFIYGKCRNLVCKCDLIAARCFAKSPYQKKYKNHPQEKCVEAEGR